MSNWDAQIEVRPGFPDEIWSTVNPQTVAAKWIAPHWASRVVFEYHAKQDYICELIMNPESCEFQVNVSDDWLTQPEESRPFIIIRQLGIHNKMEASDKGK
jgi:hypothetical protein